MLLFTEELVLLGSDAVAPGFVSTQLRVTRSHSRPGARGTEPGCWCNWTLSLSCLWIVNESRLQIQALLTSEFRAAELISAGRLQPTNSFFLPLSGSWYFSLWNMATTSNTAAVSQRSTLKIANLESLAAKREAGECGAYAASPSRKMNFHEHMHDTVVILKHQRYTINWSEQRDAYRTIVKEWHEFMHEALAFPHEPWWSHMVWRMSMLTYESAVERIRL